MPGSRIHFVGPVVCRSPGLPFDRLTRLAAHPVDAEALPARLEADRQHLWAQLDDPLVVDAFASMNPQTLGNLLATRTGDRHLGKRTADVKRDERTLFKFLTRFASRNDTTGSAGSTVWGEWTSAPGTAVLTPGPNRHARRVVLTSPRRGAWLWRRCLPKLDPLPGRLSLAGKLQLAPNGVWNTETATLWPLNAEQLELVQRALGADASTLPRERVLELLDAGILSLEVRDGADPLDALARISSDAKVSTLAALKRTLETSAGLDAARVVMQAETTLRQLAPYEPLDLGHALELVVSELLEQAPTFVRVVRSRRFSAGEACFVDAFGQGDAQAPQEIVDLVSSMTGPASVAELDLDPAHVHALVEAGVLLFEGEPSLRAPRLEGRYTAQVTALSKAVLPQPHRERIEWLRDAWPLQGAHGSTAVAMGQLTTALAGNVRTMKTDRTLFIEDTSRDARFTLGTTLSQRLSQALEPWFRLTGYLAWLDERREQALLRSVLPLGEAAPLPRFLALLSSARETLRREKLAERALGLEPAHDDLSPLRFTVRDDGRAELSLDDLPPEYLAWERRVRLITELDLMLAGDGADGRWVVNEAHALSAEGLPLVTLFPHAQPDAVVDAMIGRGLAQQLFGHGVVIPDAATHSKQSEAILRALGDARIAVTGERGPWFPQWMTPVAAATVLVTNTERGLEVSVDGAPCPFASAAFCSGDFRIVGYVPDELGELASMALGSSEGPLGSTWRPDVCMGNLTIARASLVVDVELLSGLVRAKGEFALLSEGRRLAREFGLPDHVFLKLRGKPFLVDWTSVFSLEVLVAELRGATGTVSISRMDPAPAELWMKLPDGRYTSELRFITVSDGADCRLAR